MTSVFEPYRSKNYPYAFSGTLQLDSIAGGVPRDPKTLEGHLIRKVEAADQVIRAQVIEIAAEQDIGLDEAVEKLAALKGYNGFRKDEKGLYIGGYQLKACLKEAASIAASAGRLPKKWGEMSKQGKALIGWFPEHVIVRDHKLHLGVQEPTEVVTSFVHKMGPRGPQSAIQNTEIVRDATIQFTIETDHAFEDEQWAAIWLTAERSGLGAAKPMGYGTFAVTRWEREKQAKGKLKAA